mgnify:CR=1 FL=1
MLKNIILGLILFTTIISAQAEELPTLKVGVLKYGTVNWELKAMKQLQLDKQAGFNLQVVPFAGKQATATAIHGGAVDAMVSDWIWVSRQRATGKDFGFAPYSRMVGGMMAGPDSEINDLQDLSGKKIGIAGGPVDKSWVLFQALAKHKYGLNLKQSNELVFGAPPLLSEKLGSGELDVVITFWHYAAKLEAKGYKRVIDVAESLQELMVNPDVPMLGYVFAPELLNEQPDLANKLIQASRQVKAILADKGAPLWEQLRPAMKAKDDATFNSLKNGFIAGIPASWGEEERQAANELFATLASIGGSKLVGDNQQLAPGTFVKTIKF